MVYLQETAAESPFPSHLNARLEEAAENDYSVRSAHACGSKEPLVCKHLRHD